MGVPQNKQLLVGFVDNSIVIDFTKTQLFWKRLNKNLDRLLLGNHNYKLSKLEKDKRSKKSFKNEDFANYNFSKCVVNHNFNKLLIKEMAHKLPTLVQTTSLNEIQNLHFMLDENLDPMLLHTIHTEILDPLFHEHLLNMFDYNPNNEW